MQEDEYRRYYTFLSNFGLPPGEVDKISWELQNVFLTILKYQTVKEGEEHDEFMEASRAQDKQFSDSPKYAKYKNVRSINPYPKNDMTGRPTKKIGKRNPQYRSKLEEFNAKRAEEDGDKKQGEVKET